MKPEIKKLLILNAPYLLFVYLFDKVGQAVRLAPGEDMSAKLLSIGDGFSAAFSNAFPSVHPADLLIGIAGAVIVRLAVYIKGKNAKKYRKGIEYGSARCRAYLSEKTLSPSSGGLPHQAPRFSFPLSRRSFFRPGKPCITG